MQVSQLHAPIEINAEFPEKLHCLFAPRRYKVLYGGRGAGRSWGVARALLIQGTSEPLRILCCRELQNSIAESVHKLLSDQIEALGLGHFYEIQVAKIIGRNGTTFSFEGIKNNSKKIKSYEGIDRCWVEEANNVSKASWGILIPTVRKENSEIWLTFNPELETDYTYQYFVRNPSKDTIVVKMNWRDNPFFPEVLREEKDKLKKLDEDSYLNIWEGNPLQMLEGVVFAKQLRRAQEDSRICHVPWHTETPVDTFWDLGRADMTTIWFVQRVAMQYRILAYFEDSGEDILYYLRECQNREYLYGTMYLPHDAKAKRMGQKHTIEQTVRKHGFKVTIVPRISQKVNAINAARLIFNQCYFDEDGCVDGLARLRRYKYKVVEGQFSQEPLHDENSHAADGFMTFAQAIKVPGRGLDTQKLRSIKSKFVDLTPGLGWLR